MIPYKSLFRSRLNHLQEINLEHLEEYFLGVPFELLSSAIDVDDAKKIIDILVEAAQETGFTNVEDLRLNEEPIRRLLTDNKKVKALFDWLGSDLGMSRDQESLEAIVNANGTVLPSYLLVNSTFQSQEMAQAYCPFIDNLHKKRNNFVIYVARDAASLFEVDTYLARLNGERKRAGLIYRSGLRIDYRSFDTTNLVLNEIMRTVSLEFLEEDRYSLKTTEHLFDRGMKPEGETNLKLREEYAEVPTDVVYGRFESRVVEMIAEELSRDRNSVFYKQSRDYFNQMKMTGVFDSKKQMVTFVDTGGTGKTILYSKAVFDYFSGPGKIKSGCLLVKRYKNYTNQGQANIPGFPSIMDCTGSGGDETKADYLPHGINQEVLAQESDIQPFYAAEVVTGNVKTQPNPLSIQMLCLVRSIINWNQAVAYTFDC